MVSGGGGRWWGRGAVLALAAAGLLLARDRSTPVPRHEAEWVRAGDVRVRAVRAGTGDTTLLLLHGWGESLLAWRNLVDPLAEHYRVLAIDLPGMGLSDKPAGPYDLAAMTRRLADLLDHETSGPVVVVGHSMGGELAAALAIAHPERVVAAVLIAPAGYALSPALDSLTGRTADLLGWLNVAVGYVVPLHDPAWLDEPAERRAYDPMADPAYRAAATVVLRQFDFAALRDSFPKLRQPTLLLWGRRDPTIPWAVGERIAALLPCRTFVTFPTALHRPHTTQPEAVLAEIRKFLRNPPACANVLAEPR